jgi:hypothetical protein
LTDKIGPTKLFRVQKTGKRFLAAKDPSGDPITADLDENDKPINAQNRVPKEEVNELLDKSVVEKVFGDKFVEKKGTDRF